MRLHSPPINFLFCKFIKQPIMKELFISLLLTSFFSSAKSQLNQGTWLAGGTASFYSYTSDYSSAAYSNKAKYTQINLSATVGYFVADKLAFGLRPGFSSIKGRVTTPGGGYTNVQRYWFGPFGRYYFLQKDKPFNIVTDVSYQYGIFNAGRQKGKLKHFLC